MQRSAFSFFFFFVFFKLVCFGPHPFLFFFFFCNLKSIFRKQTLHHVRCVQSNVQNIFLSEGPICASCTLKNRTCCFPPALIKCAPLFPMFSTSLATSVASTVLLSNCARWRTTRNDQEDESRTSFFFLRVQLPVQSFLMLLYYYDYYCCFSIIIVIIIMTRIVISLAAATQEQIRIWLLADFSWVVEKWKVDEFRHFHFWRTARSFPLEVKYQLWFLPVWIQALFSISFGFVFLSSFSHYLAFLHTFSLFKRKTSNLCLLQWENASFLFSVKFYGTDLYNFKSSYFSIHAEYSSITTKTC